MEKKPNILFYFTDQQRPDTIGCYGQRLPVTPVLDALAEDGVVFTNAYTCQPVCGPARACLQTGRYASDTGSFVNSIGLQPEDDTIAKQLRRAGYETAYVGKWHLSCDFNRKIFFYDKPIPPERRGGYEDYAVMCEALEDISHGYDGHIFDTAGKRLDFIGYRPDCITDYAIHYLHNRNREKPFFLFVSHIEPHQQNDRGRYEGPDGSKEKFACYDPPADLLCREKSGDWRENYPDYLGCCNSLDYNLGRLLDTLRECGEYDNTILIFCSDHGCHFRTREGENKRQCFDSCLHIPLVICGGMFRGGKRVDELVSLINLPPTILTMAGIPVPPSMVEEPVQNLFAEETHNWQTDIFYQISEAELARGIRTRQFKYCVSAPHVQPLQNLDDVVETEKYLAMVSRCVMSSDSYIEQYLFDLDSDPTESVNLIEAPDYEQIRTELRGMLCRHMEKAGEKTPVIYTAAQAREKGLLPQEQRA